MNSSVRIPRSIRHVCLLSRVALALVLVAGSSRFVRAADATGSITGTVSNAATHNLLAGAQVEVPALGLITTADRTGQFRLNNVPAGDYDLQVSYTGLDPERKTVHVDTNASATANF